VRIVSLISRNPCWADLVKRASHRSKSIGQHVRLPQSVSFLSCCVCGKLEGKSQTSLDASARIDTFLAARLRWPCLDTNRPRRCTVPRYFRERRTNRYVQVSCPSAGKNRFIVQFTGRRLMYCSNSKAGSQQNAFFQNAWLHLRMANWRQANGGELSQLSQYAIRQHLTGRK